MDRRDVATRLAAARGSKTQRQVAKDLGIGVSTIGMYESGKRVPRDAIKEKIAAYYGIPVQDLFFNCAAHE